MTELPRPQLAVYLTAALALGWVAMRWLDAPPAVPATARSTTATARTTPVRVSAGEGAVVDVAGAVRRPGVYRLQAGARVQDAVRRAGGLARSADGVSINLAAKVSDGTQIIVPARATGAGADTGTGAGVATGTSVGASTAGAGPGGAAPVNLNTATAEQLDTLDGVGPATADKILAFRRAHGGFSSVAQLDQVSGIGPKKLAALRGQVTV